MLSAKEARDIVNKLEEDVLEKINSNIMAACGDKLRSISYYNLSLGLIEKLESLGYEVKKMEVDEDCDIRYLISW